MALVHRILSALLALALFLGGLLAVVEIVLAALGRPPWLVPYEQWTTWLREQAWDAPVVRVVLAGIVVLGLVLLALALRRGKPHSVPLPARDGGPGGVHVSASRRGVEKTLATAARRTSGVSAATVTAGRHTVRVKAKTAMRSPGDLQQQVTASVTARLDELGLAGTRRPRVTLKRKEAR